MYQNVKAIESKFYFIFFKPFNSYLHGKLSKLAAMREPVVAGQACRSGTCDAVRQHF